MFISYPVVTAVLLAIALESPLEPLGKFDTRVLPEASGIVKSRRHRGIYWVHNDSGNPPSLFAIRQDGSIVREFRLEVPNIDWEDIADDGEGHLYLGDIGNNGGLLALRAVYRFDEPDPTRPSSAPVRVTSSTFYFLDRDNRFDAEGLVYEPGASLAVIISKRFDGREAELFTVPFKPPAPLLRPAKPRPIGSLPGFVEPATGASLSADSRLLAVCSYAVTRVYQRRGDGPWQLLAEVRYDALEVEGITWDEGDLILVSEGRGTDRISEATWRRAAGHAPTRGPGRPGAR
jgi:hypothetical protein